MKRVFCVLLAVLFSVVSLGCSYENISVGELEVVYLIDDKLTPYCMLVFESKWSKNASFVVNAVAEPVSWTSTCSRIEKSSKSYNCTRPFAIPFHDSKVHELKVDISYNNSKIKRSAEIRNPYYFFLSKDALSESDSDSNSKSDSDSASDDGASPDIAVVAEIEGEEAAEVFPETEEAQQDADAEGDASADMDVEDIGYGKSDDDSGAGGGDGENVVVESADEPNASESNLPPPVRRDDVIWRNRSEIADAIRSSGIIFKASASKSSGSRLGIYLDNYSNSHEIYYGLQKRDGEVSNTARINGKNTKANITSTISKLVLLEKVSSLPTDNSLYLIKVVSFE